MKEVHRMETDDLRTQVDEQARLIDQQQLQLRTLQRTIQRLDDRSSLQPRKAGVAVSRFGLLKTTGAIAAGIAGLTILGGRVSAAAGGAVGQTLSFLKVSGPAPQSGIGVDASSQSANFKIAVFGRSPRGVGVEGAGKTGVKGTSSDYQSPAIQAVNTAGGDGVFGKSPGNGVHGHNTTLGIGVLGTANGGTAVAGEDSGSGTGVYGSSKGVGVQGMSLGGYDGVAGSTSGAKSGAGVRGRGGSGIGVDGSSDGAIGVRGTSGTFAGVYGTGPTYGVYGENNAGNDGVYGTTSGEQGGAGVYGDSNLGPGVYGRSIETAGGQFESESSGQLHLRPGGADVPSSARNGDFFVNSQGYLYYYRDGWRLVV